MRRHGPYGLCVAAPGVRLDDRNEAPLLINADGFVQQDFSQSLAPQS